MCYALSMPKGTDDLPTRFWKKVAIAANAGECWAWIGSKLPRGYGMLRTSPTFAMRAHRYSYELHNGPIPDGALVLHKCDNPNCVNPEHLFLGSQSDNMADMWKKGRHRRVNPQWLAGAKAKGEAHGGAKLTNEDVGVIRAKLASGENATAIARQFGVRSGCVRDIKHRKTWTHLP